MKEEQTEADPIAVNVEKKEGGKELKTRRRTQGVNMHPHSRAAICQLLAYHVIVHRVELLLIV